MVKSAAKLPESRNPYAEPEEFGKNAPSHAGLPTPPVDGFDESDQNDLKLLPAAPKARSLFAGDNSDAKKTGDKARLAAVTEPPLGQKKGIFGKIANWLGWGGARGQERSIFEKIAKWFGRGETRAPSKDDIQEGARPSVAPLETVSVEPSAVSTAKKTKFEFTEEQYDVISELSKNPVLKEKCPPGTGYALASILADDANMVNGVPSLLDYGNLSNDALRSHLTDAKSFLEALRDEKIMKSDDADTPSISLPPGVIQELSPTIESLLEAINARLNLL